MHQMAGAAVEDEARPFARAGVGGRSEGDGLSGGADSGQATLDLEFGASWHEHGDAWYDGQGDASGDDDIA